MQRLDHQRAARGEQGVHGGEQRDDVLVQQREVGADQVVAAADVRFALRQRFIARQVHRRRARRSRRLDQRRIAIDTDCGDASFSQRPQQPALAAAQVEHALRLATQHRQQNGLVGDLQAAFDGAGTDGFDPEPGVVVPALEEGGFGGGHFAVRHGVIHLVKRCLKR
ncbi:hypothetical protein D3C86_1475090 [compost metagenome]